MCLFVGEQPCKWLDCLFADLCVYLFVVFIQTSRVMMTHSTCDNSRTTTHTLHGIRSGMVGNDRKLYNQIYSGFLFIQPVVYYIRAF